MFILKSIVTVWIGFSMSSAFAALKPNCSAKCRIAPLKETLKTCHERRRASVKSCEDSFHEKYWRCVEGLKASLPGSTNDANDCIQTLLGDKSKCISAIENKDNGSFVKCSQPRINAFQQECRKEKCKVQ